MQERDFSEHSNLGDVKSTNKKIYRDAKQTTLEERLLNILIKFDNERSKQLVTDTDEESKIIFDNAIKKLKSEIQLEREKVIEEIRKEVLYKVKVPEKYLKNPYHANTVQKLIWRTFEAINNHIKYQRELLENLKSKYKL